MPVPPKSLLSTDYQISAQMCLNRHPRFRGGQKSQYSNAKSAVIQQAPLLTNKEYKDIMTDMHPPASRFLAVLQSELSGFPLHTLIHEQKHDAIYAPIRYKLEQGIKQSGYFIFQGILLKAQKQPTLKISVCLPQQLGKRMLSYMHSSVHLFHFLVEHCVWLDQMINSA